MWAFVYTYLCQFHFVYLFHICQRGTDTQRTASFTLMCEYVLRLVRISVFRLTCIPNFEFRISDLRACVILVIWAISRVSQALGMARCDKHALNPNDLH